MSSPKARPALERLGQDIRNARLRRGIAVADLAARAGTSPSSISRLEKGDRGVAIGTLADVLVVMGLVERLADLVDIRSYRVGASRSRAGWHRRDGGRQFPGRHRSAYSAAQSRAHRAARHNALPRFPRSPVAVSPSTISFRVLVRQTVLWRPAGICPLTLDL